METFAAFEVMSYRALTYSPEGIPASLSVRPESAGENLTRGIFGPSSRASFAYFDPDMSCWRTSQATFLSGLDQFSETWPDSGTMRNGCVYGLQISERPTCESACSSWPTAQAHDAGGMRGNTMADHHYKDHDLVNAAMHWPTARSEDGESCGNHPGATDSLTGATRHWQTPATDSFRSRGGDRSDEMGLDQQARFWPTASARDWKSGDASQETMERNARPLNEIAQHWDHSHLDPQTPAGQPSSESAPTSRRRLLAGLIRVLSAF